MPKPTKTVKKPKPLASKTVKAMELIDKGLDIRDAHKLATGIEKPHPNTIYDLKKKYDKWLLSKQSTVKLASKVVVDTMKFKGKETDALETCPGCKAGTGKDDCKVCNGTGVLRKVIFPTYSNALEASNMVYDRIDPVVKQSVNLNINKTFIDIDINEYQS